MDLKQAAIIGTKNFLDYLIYKGIVLYIPEETKNDIVNEYIESLYTPETRKLIENEMTKMLFNNVKPQN